MLFDAPFRLGPFIVDADGRLTPTTPQQFPAFHIAWHGLVVHARLASTGPQGGALALRTVLGRVPSTGRPEAAEILPRQTAFATLRALPPTLPPGLTVELLPDHRVLTQAQTQLSLPTSAENLLTELTLFLLRLAPYLDLLAEGVGIEPAGDGTGVLGSVNTWPG